MTCCSGCIEGTGLCAQSPAILMGDPLAIMAANAATSAGAVVAPTIGGVLPTVVWPEDVRARKRDIDPTMRATDASVHACTALAAADRKAWSDFFGAWVVFFNEDVPWFGSANKWDRANDFAKQLAAWQGLLRPTCSIPGPPPIPPNELDDSSISAIKWAAAAVIAVAVVYGVRTVVR